MKYNIENIKEPLAVHCKDLAEKAKVYATIKSPNYSIWRVSTLGKLIVLIYPDAGVIADADKTISPIDKIDAAQFLADNAPKVEPWQPKVGDFVNVPTTKNDRNQLLNFSGFMRNLWRTGLKIEYGTIKSIENDGSIVVRFTDELMAYFAPSDLTPYTPPKPEQEQLYAVCIDNSRSGYELTVGKRYQVSQNDTDKDRWNTINDSNKPDQFHKMHFAAPFTLPKEDKKYCYTSHDGVKMYEGDDVWFVNPLINSIMHGAAQEDDATEFCKFFSTQSAAQAWLDEQKGKMEQATPTKSRELTARQLQDIKTDLEINIANMLHTFNQTCVENGFQLEQVVTYAQGFDDVRAFEVDIHII